MESLYNYLDISNAVNLVISRALKAETTLSEFVKIFEKQQFDRRLDRSEYVLNENQEMDFLLMNYNNLKNSRFAFLDNLPPFRVLTGSNTDSEGESSTDGIMKSNIFLFRLLYE
jgi:hypothetical protein